MKWMKIAILSLLTIALVACSSNAKDDSTQKDDEFDKIKEAGVIRVGMCPEYPPFETINDKGDIEGFDVDLANAIGEKLGLKIEFVNTPYEGLIAGLQNGDFDLIMSGMSPREANAADKTLNVTDSYYAVDEIVMTKDQSIKTKEDLKGRSVGSHAGSTSEYAVDKLKEDGIDLTSKPYNRHSEAFADLQNDNIDAQVVERTWAEQKVKDEDGIQILEEPIYSIDMAGIMPQNGASFKEAYNKALKEIKDSGELDKLLEKWSL